MKRISILSCCALVAVGLLTSCAMKVAPSGGPRNTTPAEVAATTPTDGSRNVKRRAVTIEFSDYVNRNIRNAIIVQPAVRFTSTYSGNEIDVVFEEELQPNTTYTVTLGTDWQDLQGNSPTRATSVTFSTGADIDTGRIEGTVTGSNVKNVVVLLYAGADTLTADFTPASRFAQYNMPVGSAGAFTIAGLRDGWYRIVAVQDGNSNGLLDGNEDYAMAPLDVEVLQGASQPLSLLLGPSLATVRKDSIAAAEELARIDSVGVDSLSAPDSTAAIKAAPPPEPGRIEGTFSIDSTIKGPYLARFKERSGAVTAVVRVQNGESWRVEAIPPGTYNVDLVIDVNQNNRYDHGVPFPFGFAERWMPLDLTVSVRQRWTTEDVRIVVK